MKPLGPHHLLRFGPGAVWAALSFRALPRMIQSLGEGANRDQYHNGVVAMEGTNVSWIEGGFADEGTWVLDTSTQMWLPVELSGAPVEFDGTAPKLACLVSVFPRFVRFREKGTLDAGHHIDLLVSLGG